MNDGTMSRRTLLGTGAALGVAGAAAAAAAAATGAAPSSAAQGPAGRMLAPRPPMGWNSWNSFATTITEAQARDVAAVMRDRLLPFGYTIFTVDIQWYEPGATGYAYSGDPVPVMDGYGRLLPAPNRFPSAAGGAGFKPLADDIHRMGMQFGVHLMRGIPRLAVKRNLPVFGTRYRAQDIADTNSICSWNPDMYGVDMTKPGAQAYYDSVFALFASWGVDFVKMDDMSRPYDANAAEIEAAHAAIGRCGRPIMLSLSPGETPVARGEHVRRHAQMWRISDDFWDDWGMLEAQFTRLENWNAYRRPGGWPDADMLPLGKLHLGQRDTKFTPDEQRTLMTLWAIARSPLIMGGDLRHLDDATLALLTNRDVLAVNQASEGNRPHFLADGVRIWSARPEGRAAERYVALFNTGDARRRVAVSLRELGLAGPVRVRDLWSGKAAGSTGDAVAADVAPHGAALFHVAR